MGKSWFFNAKKPESVWDKVVAPLLVNWEEGSEEHIGLDPRKTKEEIKLAKQAAEDLEVGELLRLIDKQTDLAHYRDQVFPTEVKPRAGRMGLEAQARVKEAHKKKVKALGG